MPIEPLVSAKWLKKNLANVVVVDGTYYMPALNKDAQLEYETGHIPGAVRWDIDQIADTDSPLSHMMPAADLVAREAGARGISSDTAVVIYDQMGIFSAARVWLTFKSAGHKQVAVLDGGLPAWQGELEQGPAADVAAVEYGPVTATKTTVDRETVLLALEDYSAVVVDARSADRFAGIAPEPRAGLRGGHMPTSVNLPHTELIDESGKLKSRAVLSGVFHDHGVDLEMPVITSCGSGVTASIITFALALVGKPSLVYDGSWSEWGNPELDMPIISPDSAQ